LAVTRVDGTAETETLSVLSGAGVKVPCDWSLDGRFVLYKQIDQATGTTDLWALPMTGERTPLPVVRTPHDERDGQFSPDGKWIAYESDEAGSRDIYLPPLPGPGPKVRVSVDGGTQVRWRRDEKEVFYVAPTKA